MFYIINIVCIFIILYYKYYYEITSYTKYDRTIIRILKTNKKKYMYFKKYFWNQHQNFE